MWVLRALIMIIIIWTLVERLISRWDRSAPAVPAGARTWELLITSLSLYHWAIYAPQNALPQVCCGGPCTARWSSWTWWHNWNKGIRDEVPTVSGNKGKRGWGTHSQQTKGKGDEVPTLRKQSEKGMRYPLPQETKEMRYPLSQETKGQGGEVPTVSGNKGRRGWGTHCLRKQSQCKKCSFIASGGVVPWPMNLTMYTNWLIE